MPTQLLFGLTLGKIFLLPNKEPKIKAAESHHQIDITSINVKFVSIKESNCRMYTAVPNCNETIRIPPKVASILNVDP